MFTENELQTIKKIYPGLKHITDKRKNFLRGNLHFRACYNKDIKEFIINPSENITVADTYIDDGFEIEIEFLQGFPKQFPLVREVGGRIQQIVEKYSLQDVVDLHINKSQDNAACFCPKPAEKLRYPDKINLIHFINNLVVPFFYGLSFYEKHGLWPWDEYSHGNLGIFEFYAENKGKKDLSIAKSCYECLDEQGKKIIMSNKRIKGHWPCICGSKEKFRKCHKLVLEGIWALKNDIKEENLAKGE